MRTRREFLTSTAAGIATLALRSTAFSEPARHPLGVQLYTVRQQAEADLPPVLAAIQKIGYRIVETYNGLYSHPAPELRKMILDSSLAVPSAHFSYEGFEIKFDYAKELGAQDVVCSSIPPKIANSLDGYKRAANQFNLWGAQAQKLGLRFGFHNHNAEFQSFDGTTGHEILMRETDPSLVMWQMDAYWVSQAGLDPVEQMRKYPHRIMSLHLKDRKMGAEPSVIPGPGSQHFTEIGTGTLNWKGILAEADKQRVRYMFVEQDKTEIPPLQSLQISFDNLSKLMV
ncbi:MAG: sugar phosphate isomerase/epimerase family protein [Acidobacteriaceae bacterium]